MQVIIFCELGFETPIHAPKIGGLGAKYGKGWCDVDPNELVLTYGVVPSVPLLVKVDQEMRPWVWGQTDRQTDGHTHWQRQTGFIICPVLYAIAMGQITRFFYKKKTVLLFQPVYAVVYKCTLKLCLFYCRSTVLYIWSYRFACTSLPAIKRGLSFYGYLIITTLPR